MVWELFRGLGLPQRDVFGLDCSRHAMGPSDFCGFHGFHKRFALYLPEKSTKPMSWTTAVPWVACMYANWVWRCDGPSFALAGFIRLDGFHEGFARYCSWKFEVHCPGGLVRTWVGHMHANSAQRFPYTQKSRSRWLVHCRSASTIHALKAPMPTWRGTMWIHWKS